MSTAWNRVPGGTMTIIPLFHDGYAPTRHGHRSLPNLNAMHAYLTTDPELADKLERDIKSTLRAKGSDKIQ